MRIGIDISQTAYENTGVANFLSSLLKSLSQIDKTNQYILFYSSLRNNSNLKLASNFEIKTFRIPPKVLDFLWNKLHIMPIESLIGDVDVFITSDWTEPPTKRAKKTTILYDLIVFKYPDQTAKKIVDVQKRKLAWVKKESSKVLCISEATKKDAEDILGISKDRLEVIGAGI